MRREVRAVYDQVWLLVEKRVSFYYLNGALPRERGPDPSVTVVRCTVLWNGDVRGRRR